MSLPKHSAAPACPYCSGPSALVSGDVIYPHRPDLHEKKFYSCASCNAYVGCHPGTVVPLGRLANAELRLAKNRAHSVFDPLWRDGSMRRVEAYKWLAQSLGIPRKQAHIGMFDVAQCKAVVDAVKARQA